MKRERERDSERERERERERKRARESERGRERGLKIYSENHTELLRKYCKEQQERGVQLYPVATAGMRVCVCVSVCILTALRRHKCVTNDVSDLWNRFKERWCV